MTISEVWNLVIISVRNVNNATAYLHIQTLLRESVEILTKIIWEVITTKINASQPDVMLLHMSTLPIEYSSQGLSKVM